MKVYKTGPGQEWKDWYREYYGLMRQTYEETMNFIETLGSWGDWYIDNYTLITPEGRNRFLSGVDKIAQQLGMTTRSKKQQKLLPQKRKPRPRPARGNKSGYRDFPSENPQEEKIDVTEAPERANDQRQNEGVMISIPTTIKCLDLPSKRVRGIGKRPNIPKDIIGQWKSFKINSGLTVTSGASRVGFYGLESEFDNTATIDNTKPVVSVYRCVGFNSVDKLLYIQDNFPDNSASYKLPLVTSPDYDTTNPNIISDARDMNTVVCLRNQHVRIHMQNNATVESGNAASVTLFMFELKKDMFETQINTTDMKVIEDAVSAGWTEEFGAAASNNPPVIFDVEQRSYFFMKENPVFEEYFKICFAKSICFQPQQIVTQTFSMKPMQVLSYKFMGKNQFVFDGTDPKWIHCAKKKGEKVFFVKQHGIMAYAAEPAGPGYTQAAINYWFESEWEAAKVNLESSVKTVDANNGP